MFLVFKRFTPGLLLGLIVASLLLSVCAKLAPAYRPVLAADFTAYPPMGYSRTGEFPSVIYVLKVSAGELFMAWGEPEIVNTSGGVALKWPDRVAFVSTKYRRFSLMSVVNSVACWGRCELNTLEALPPTRPGV